MKKQVSEKYKIWEIKRKKKKIKQGEKTLDLYLTQYYPIEI